MKTELTTIKRTLTEIETNATAMRDELLKRRAAMVEAIRIMDDPEPQMYWDRTQRAIHVIRAAHTGASK